MRTDELINFLGDMDEEWDVNGDLVLGESTKQHQALLLITDTGEWKDNPVVGIGIDNYEDDDIADLNGDINRGFTQDGMTVTYIGPGADGKLSVAANYN